MYDRSNKHVSLDKFNHPELREDEKYFFNHKCPYCKKSLFLRLGRKKYHPECLKKKEQEDRQNKKPAWLNQK